MARQEEFDWIDDAFDEKRTAHDMEMAKGSNAIGCAFIVVLVGVVIFIIFACVGLFGALTSL